MRIPSVFSSIKSLCLVIFVCTLVACNGRNSGLGNSGGGDPADPAPPPGSQEFVYATTPGSASANGEAEEFSVNQSSGALVIPSGQNDTPIPNTTGGILSDPLERFVYVSDSAADNVLVFEIDAASGQLSPTSTSPSTGGTGASGMAADSTGKFLYVANSGSNNISAFGVDASGNLTLLSGSPFAAGNAPMSLALSPSNNFLFASSSSAEISVFAVGSNGGLTAIAGSPFATSGGSSSWLAMHPSGQFLFAVTNNNSIAAFTISSNGSLSEVSGSPFSVGHSPQEIAITPNGQFLYVSNLQDNTVSGFSINQTTGSLSPVSGSPFQGFSAPLGVSTDALGSFLFVANSGASGLSAFTIDQTSGALSAVAGSPFASVATPQQLVLVDIQ